MGGSFLAKFILVFITFSNSISIDKKQLGANKLINGLNKSNFSDKPENYNNNKS